MQDLKQKIYRILRPFLIEPTRINVPGRERNCISFLDPLKIVQIWLSKREIFDQVVAVNNIIRPYILDESLVFTLGGCQMWNFPELIKSSIRARSFWTDRLPQDPRKTLFLHFGLYFDHFSAGIRKVGILNLRILDLDATAAERLPTYFPLALFEALDTTKGFKDELMLVFASLQPLLERLAQGIEFIDSAGNFYAVYSTISMVFGDIPAIYQMLGMKISSTSYHPCIWCFMRYFAETPANLRCRLACTGPLMSTFPPKTMQQYLYAYQNLALDESSRLMSIKKFSPLIAFPAISLPESITIDFMHTDIMGQVVKHLEIVLDFYVLGPETVANINRLFGKLCRVNKESTKFKLNRNFSNLKSFPAFSILKLLLWSSYIFDNAQGNWVAYLPHRELFEKRVKFCKMLLKKHFDEPEILLLESKADEIHRQCCAAYPDFCTLKTHLSSKHYGALIRRFGAPYLYYCFRAESLNKGLKVGFRNANGVNTANSALKRELCMKVMDLIRGWDEFLPNGNEAVPLSCYGILRKGSFVVPVRSRFNIHCTIYKVLSFRNVEADIIVTLLKCPIRFVNGRDEYFIDPDNEREEVQMGFGNLVSVDMGPSVGSTLVVVCSTLATGSFGPFRDLTLIQ
jgi:hypothetical protein